MAVLQRLLTKGFTQMCNDVANIAPFVLPGQAQRQIAENAGEQRFPAVIGEEIFCQRTRDRPETTFWLGAKNKEPLGSERAVVK